jgi:glucose-1-phosphate thymidylyltransferase
MKGSYSPADPAPALTQSQNPSRSKSSLFMTSHGLFPLSLLLRHRKFDIPPARYRFFRELFGDGDWLGMRFEYAVQETPRGLADAFIVGERFIGNDSCALVLGDNVFYGRGFSATLRQAASTVSASGGGVIFGYYVKDPTAYGVVEFGSDGKGRFHRGKSPLSRNQTTRFRGCTSTTIASCRSRRASSHPPAERSRSRPSTTPTCEEGRLSSRHSAAGGLARHGYLRRPFGASNFIATIQKRQGCYVSCIEEIAYANGWIDRAALLALRRVYKTDMARTSLDRGAA